MADAQEEPAAPPPKEKKKKKSSSVKSNKSATEEAPPVSAAEAAASEPNAAAAADPPTPGSAPLEAESAAPAEGEAVQETGAGPETADENAPLEVLTKIEPATKEPPPPPQLSPKQMEQEEAALAHENKMRELAEGFFLLDFNKDGQIDKSDLQIMWSTLGYSDVADEEIDAMLSSAPSGLDLDTFVSMMGRKLGEMDPEDILVTALSNWDMDSSGYISEERIRRDLMTWGDIFTEEEINSALEDAPIYQESEGPMIDYIEFCKILSGNPSPVTE